MYDTGDKKKQQHSSPVTELHDEGDSLGKALILLQYEPLICVCRSD